jgi:hypothetical protein
MSNELGEFLRSRRAQLQPEDVGFRAGRGRRVEGLRREWVAGQVLMVYSAEPGTPAAAADKLRTKPFISCSFPDAFRDRFAIAAVDQERLLEGADIPPPFDERPPLVGSKG